MPNFITRFAPSPTGFLHLGHAYSARLAFDAARMQNGVCLLRIEDTDQTRCRLEFETAILKDLSWLGLTWPEPVRRQSDHLEAYCDALALLQDKGLVYRCFKTRKEVINQIASAPHDAGPENMYGEGLFRGSALSRDEEAANLEAGKAFAWRLSMDKCRDYLGEKWTHLFFEEEGSGPNGETGKIRVRPDMFGDAIIGRKDTGTSYHMACLHDDHLQNITHIIRGHDLFYVTYLHILIQNLMDWKTPIYCHHRLLLDENGKRFAKRDKAKTIAALRQEGCRVDEIWRRCGVNTML